MPEPVELKEVYQIYANALGKQVDTLSDAEKRQAFLDAVLSGKRVEPFASWCDDGDAVFGKLLPEVKTLNQLIQSETDVSK